MSILTQILILFQSSKLNRVKRFKDREKVYSIIMAYYLYTKKDIIDNLLGLNKLIAILTNLSVTEIVNIDSEKYKFIGNITTYLNLMIKKYNFPQTIK